MNQIADNVLIIKLKSSIIYLFISYYIDMNTSRAERVGPRALRVYTNKNVWAFVFYAESLISY